MKVNVIKFGGSSLKDEPSMEQAVFKVLEHLQEAERVVVVVSAMGRFPAPYATDTLASFATHLSSRQTDRLLAMGESISSLVFENHLRAHQIHACAISIEENGILCDDAYGHAHVLYVSNKRIIHALRDYEVVIVPGFTATSITGKPVTLGRGGSDYSAFLIAAALSVPFVSIYTDVQGVYDQDPQKVPEATIYETLTMDEMLELIQQGAKVMQKESVLYARQQNISFEVRSTFSNEKGTMVTASQRSSAITPVHKINNNSE